MAGKIVADQIEHSTAGSIATNYVVNGSTKVWCNNDQNGTHDIGDSFNISSISDIQAGSTQYTYTSAMANANHAPHTSGFDTSIYYEFATFNLSTTGHRGQVNLNDLEGMFTSTNGDLA